MATGTSLGIIGLGTPTVVTPSLTILGIGDEGSVGAQRLMTHPDSANFPPIAYWRNPDYDYGLDNEVIQSPITSLQRTLTSAALVRFDRPLTDSVVVEFWEGSQTRASMPMFQFRQLLEYWLNVPAFVAGAPDYITWQPRDRNSKTYQIEIVGITVGGGDDRRRFKMRQFRLEQGPTWQSALAGLDVSPTGLLLESVAMELRPIAEV